MIWTHTVSPSPPLWRTYAAYFSPLAVRSASATIRSPLPWEPTTGKLRVSSVATMRGASGQSLTSTDPVGASGEIYSQRLFFGIFADGFESNDTTAWSL